MRKRRMDDARNKRVYELPESGKPHPDARLHAELSIRLDALQRRTPGWRRRFRYEETFGMPREEQLGIKAASAWNLRILSELQYLLNLAEIDQALSLKPLVRALDHLEAAMAAEGVLTDRVCQEAEDCLSDLVEAARKPELILVGHAHLDMNWMWGMDETVAAVIATVRTMLDLMDEDPDYHFAQSQASVYHIVEHYAPELKAEIEARIREGRWEVTATNWVETDRNMPSTASLLDHLAQTRRYMSTIWGVPESDLKLDFHPDTFGHSRQIPHLNRLGGLPWMYHCRGVDGDHVLYRWQADPGDEVLVYREPYWYNSAITPHIGIGLPDIMRRSGGLAMGLVVYGVGNHGGGATRRDLTVARAMMDWPLWPRLRFGRYSEFFEAAECVRDRLPLVKRELNVIFAGCYTSQSRVKAANRLGERSLYEARVWDALAPREGRFPVPDETVRKLLLMHFHDILTGSNTRASREYALGNLQEVAAGTGSRLFSALGAIGRRINTEELARRLLPERREIPELGAESAAMAQSPGAGPGFGLGVLNTATRTERGSGLVRVWQVYNQLPHERTETVELQLWDWPGDLRQLRIHDDEGNLLPCQLLDHELVRYWDHQYVRLLVRLTVPALGYASVLLDEAPMEKIPVYYQNPIRSHKAYEDIVLENERLRATFSITDGALISLIDKATGAERVTAGERGGLRRIETEAKTSSAWVIGRHTGAAAADLTEVIEPRYECGELRQGFRMKQHFGPSTVTTTIYLNQDADGFDVDLDVDWQERTEAGRPVPLLAWYLPVGGESWRNDIPGGSISRPAAELDYPASSFMAAITGDRAVVFANANTYGYRIRREGLLLNLLHASTSPDADPERGGNRFRLRVSCCSADPAALKASSLLFLQPLRAWSESLHEGTAPARAGLLGLEPGAASLTKLERLPDGGTRLILTNEDLAETVVSFGEVPAGMAIFRCRTLHEPGVRVTDEAGRTLAVGETAIFDLRADDACAF
ncbi:MAG: glycoside hydrolase family 38 C-terminal domain-containing protein [Bacillota bacterium]|nr:glycoside hydrolase family 38 C-terminal domain-containing protein [Bacillota bacterium]